MPKSSIIDAIRTERERLIAERLAEMPKPYRAKYLKATEGRSLRAAIDAFCMECVGWEYKEVRKCTAKACSLWPVRPHQEARLRNDR